MRIYPLETQDNEYQTLGALGYAGSLNDRQFKYLRSLGYTGALTDMFYQFFYTAFSLSDLFANGEQGSTFPDLNPASGMLFQDDAGTTPAPVHGDPVALVLDGSQGVTSQIVYDDPTASNNYYEYTWDITSTTGYDMVITTADGGNWTHRGTSYPSGSTYQTFGADSDTLTVTGGPDSQITQFRSSIGALGFDIADLPAGLTLYQNQGSNTTYGDIGDLPSNIVSYVNQGSNTTSGDLGDLPSGLIQYLNHGSNTTSGDLGDLPSNMKLYSNEGSNTTSGDLGDLPAGLFFYQNQGSNTTSGDLGDLPSGMSVYQNQGSNTTTGDIGDLPSGLTYYANRGSNTCTMTKPWSMATARFRYLGQTGTQSLSTTAVDYILAQADSAVTSWFYEKIVDVSGNNAAPTGGASNANILSLQGKGVTVVFNT